jgi:hypothetical protein
MLLLTRLAPVEIALTKAFAHWLPAANLAFTGVPFLVAATWAAGLERESLLALLVVLSCSAFMASLAILASARGMRVVVARGQATGWIFGWLLAPPILTIIPVTSGTLWGELLAELKRLCTLIAPSSPLSLATDPGWYYRANAISLEGRVALMIGLQALFGLLAVGLALGSLKAREKHPNWPDPTRGHRPRCGDDPIFWREYGLPVRRGAGSLLVIRLRYIWILTRSILLSLLALVVAILAVAVPIGLLLGTIHYGSAVFRELWQRSPTFEARGHVSQLIRAATGMLAALPVLGTAAMVAGRIKAEMDRKTWDAFLTTPLTGEEVLRSKARVAVYGLRHSAWPLPILWTMGIACGVVTPLGVILTTIDLALGVWASVTLGLYLGIRPGTTNSVSNRTALTMLGYMAFHVPLLGAAMASSAELALRSRRVGSNRVAYPIRPRAGNPDNQSTCLYRSRQVDKSVGWGFLEYDRPPRSCRRTMTHH